jgi:hypothetical protein
MTPFVSATVRAILSLFSYIKRKNMITLKVQNLSVITVNIIIELFRFFLYNLIIRFFGGSLWIFQLKKTAIPLL